ncbi:glycosyltransferase [Hymenobacter yonginensis]|uniref:Glycosyltransferase n=1 Tax=Hymenobacter yonginensis TaxID=748197 RepID=A0ABY7PUZ1_9BACT|nr:glycosyltransferase [Hymenobacter yonginensis]WBO86679.1 glycosyltransferase [Hymenobacter yonginensis]
MTNTLLLLASLPLYVAAAYAVFNVLYLLIFALAGHLPARRRAVAAPAPEPASPRRFCVLMPAYRADAVIRETAPAALACARAYAGLAEVCVVADGLRPGTVAALRAEGVMVVEVAFARSTKGKALRAALAALPPTAFDAAVVLDVDNEMAPDFLPQIDAALAVGYRVVQGHRMAKNLDSPFAVLDACNEEINNHIFRLGHARLGLSASLIGSGMAFDYGYLRHLLHDIGETTGEDKEIDFRILRAGTPIAYLPTAHVLDEKTGSAAAFGTQRTRWMAAQWEFLCKYGREGLGQLGRGNHAFGDKILQSALLPRVLLLGLLGALLLLTGGLQAAGLALGPPPLLWAGLLAGTGLALLLALPARLYCWPVLRALTHLPLALGAMVLALLRLKRARLSFLPTPHAVRAGQAAPVR